MNGSVCAREKFFIRIGNLQLREKRACGGVDGALKVVSVMKSIQMMPARATGSAVMMIKGSLQDWKFTTIRR